MVNPCNLVSFLPHTAFRFFESGLKLLPNSKEIQIILRLFLKVSKFQNENMKSSHCPKYERKNLKNSALSIQGKNFQIFRPYFGQCDDFKLSF